MENRRRVNEREGGEIIEGKRENKGSREINKKTTKKRVSGEDSREVYIYIYTPDLFKKNRPLSDFIKIR